jgi:replicative DNA helicase
MNRAELVPPVSGSDEQDGAPLDAERAVLAAMMLGPDGIVRACAILGPESFHRDAHRRIFAAILALHDRSEPADLITVKEELKRRGDPEAVGGTAYVAGVFELATCAVNVEAHARIVAAAANKRGLRRLGLNLQAWAEAPTLAAAAILVRLEARLRTIDTRRGAQAPGEARHAR